MGARSRKSSLAPDDADDASFTASASHTPNNASPNSQQTLSSPSAEELHGVNSHENMSMERTEGYTDFGRSAQYQSQSQTSLHSAFTEAPSSFSPTTLSPTSPFFTPDSAISASPFMPQPLRQTHTVPSNGPNVNHNTNNASAKPRSQTFPLLDHYMSDATINSSSAEPPTPKYVASNMLDSPLQDFVDPLPNLNSAVEGMHHEGGRPHTIAPSDSMRPPPLPTSMSAPRSMTPSSASNLSVTSPEEARKAMEVVLSFFEQQPNGYLDLQESITVGKLMEKLRLQARAN